MVHCWHSDALQSNKGSWQELYSHDHKDVSWPLVPEQSAKQTS